jgi:hypothetical protein
VIYPTRPCQSPFSFRKIFLQRLSKIGLTEVIGVLRGPPFLKFTNRGDCDKAQAKSAADSAGILFPGKSFSAGACVTLDHFGSSILISRGPFFASSGTTGMPLRLLRDTPVEAPFRRDALVASAVPRWIVHFASSGMTGMPPPIRAYPPLLPSRLAHLQCDAHTSRKSDLISRNVVTCTSHAACIFEKTSPFRAACCFSLKLQDDGQDRR